MRSIRKTTVAPRVLARRARRDRTLGAVWWAAICIALALLTAPGRFAPPAAALSGARDALDRHPTVDLRAVPPESPELLSTDDPRPTGTFREDVGRPHVGVRAAHRRPALTAGVLQRAGARGAALALAPATPRAPPLPI